MRESLLIFPEIYRKLIESIIESFAIDIYFCCFWRHD